MGSSIVTINRNSSDPQELSNARAINSTNAFDISTPTTKDNAYQKNIEPGKTFLNAKQSPNTYSTDKRISNSMSNEDIIEKLNKSLNIQTSSDSIRGSFIKTANYYNRFKVPLPNQVLQKGFAHVFFVRPSCNLIENGNLVEQAANSEIFSYAKNACPELIEELVANNGKNHDFMLTLSNFATGFSLQDELIQDDTYGRTYTGYKIAYGKNNVESKTAGSFSVTFNDDRNLHIYHLHKMWVEYINGVYRGTLSPLPQHVWGKILDYVSSVYYFLTAEDGETIIFWSKYYGVFPTSVPSTQYAWSSGNVITFKDVAMTVEYRYSFKTDFDPYCMLEFNYNSNVTDNGVNYTPSYDPNLGHTGTTWVGAPFVEIVRDKNNPECPFEYKLRFRYKK